MIFHGEDLDRKLGTQPFEDWSRFQPVKTEAVCCESLNLDDSPRAAGSWVTEAHCFKRKGAKHQKHTVFDDRVHEWVGDEVF